MNNFEKQLEEYEKDYILENSLILIDKKEFYKGFLEGSIKAFEGGLEFLEDLPYEHDYAPKIYKGIDELKSNIKLAKERLKE